MTLLVMLQQTMFQIGVYLMRAVFSGQEKTEIHFFTWGGVYLDP
jgi:hypothetical protein